MMLLMWITLAMAPVPAPADQQALGGDVIESPEVGLELRRRGGQGHPGVVQVSTGGGQAQVLALVGGREQAQRHPAGIARPAGHECLDRRLGLPGELGSVVRYHRRNGIGGSGAAVRRQSATSMTAGPWSARPASM
jgi:hypothetical protein